MKIAVVSLVLIWLLYDRFIKQKSKKVTDFTKPMPHIIQKNVSSNPLRNSEKKPIEYEIQNNLSENNFEIYKHLLNKLTEFGEPSLFWRGEENGWVLANEKYEGRSGSIIMTKDNLIGQFVPSRNQLGGILSDHRFPEELREYFSADVYHMTRGNIGIISRYNKCNNYIARFFLNHLNFINIIAFHVACRRCRFTVRD